jgi:hypothetical protein
MCEEGANYFKLTSDARYRLDLRMENAFLLLGLCKEQGLEKAREMIQLMVPNS